MVRVDFFYPSPFWRTRVSYTIFQRYHPDTRKLSILGCVLKSDYEAVEVGFVLKKKSRLFSFWWMNVAWAPRYFWSSRYQAKSALLITYFNFIFKKYQKINETMKIWNPLNLIHLNLIKNEHSWDIFTLIYTIIRIYW